MLSNENTPSPYIPIEVTVTKDSTETYIDLGIGGDDPIAHYGGVIEITHPTVVVPQALSVEPEVRGFGIGERLVRELAAQAKEQGATTILSHIESEYALDIRARIFGADALRFYVDEFTLSGDHDISVELPMTFDQARQSLVRAGESEEDLEFRDHGFDVEVDIP